jgi:hypothetical protein
MTATVCDTPYVATYVPSDALRAALAAERAAKDAYDAALAELHKAIAAEVALPSKPADVARAVDYHPGSVARIARAHGVPGDPRRVPPRRADFVGTLPDGTTFEVQVKPHRGKPADS